IPIYTGYLIGENDQKSSWHLASYALNLAVLIMSSFAIIAAVLAPVFIPLLNPGLVKDHPDQIPLVITLSRIMFLQSIALGAGVITQGVLNTKQDFRLPAIGTVLYNVGLIAGLIPAIVMGAQGLKTTGQYNNIAIYSATWGVVIGAILQVSIQIPGLIKVGMHYRFVLDWKQPGIIQMA